MLFGWPVADATRNGCGRTSRKYEEVALMGIYPLKVWDMRVLWTLMPFLQSVTSQFERELAFAVLSQFLFAR